MGKLRHGEVIRLIKRHRYRTGAQASSKLSMPPFRLDGHLAALVPGKDAGQEGKSGIPKFLPVLSGLGCVTLVRSLNLSGSLSPRDRSCSGDRAGVGNARDPLDLISSTHLPSFNDESLLLQGKHSFPTLSSQSGDGVDFTTSSRYRHVIQNSQSIIFLWSLGWACDPIRASGS